MQGDAETAVRAGVTRITQSEVLEQLGAALASIDGNFERWNRVLSLRESPLGVVLAELSVMEREATSASSVRLIATAKQVLAGKASEDALVAACRAVVGV